MRKFLVLLVAGPMCGAVTNAQLLTDPFDYTADGTNGLAIQSGLWNRLNTGDSILVTSGSLSYPGVTTSGNKIAFGGTGADYWRSFTSQTSGKVYYSFLLNVTNLGTLDATGGYFTQFIQDASTSTFGSTAWLRLDGAGFNIGISKRTTVGNVVWSPTTMDLNTTYFIVVAYELVAGTTTDDIASLWVNPTLGLGSEPAADLTSTSIDTDLTSVARVQVRQDSGIETPFIEMDELIIATDWATVAFPVELTSFTAIAKGKNVELHWNTATEVNNYGFEVEKNVSGAWNKIGFVEGNGTTNAPKSYSYADANVTGTVSYRLKQIDRNGKFEYSSVVEATVADIKTFGLDQNYPNPFNPATVISYQLPVSGQVTLKVYDMLGKEVASLVNETKEAGSYSAKFDGSKLSSGIYFYTLQSGNFTATKKLTLMK